MSATLGIALATWALMQYISRTRRWLGFFIGWPATVLHELAHFLVALVLGARPSSISVWPKRLADGSRQLGSVVFEARALSAAWVALAPLAWAVVAYYLVSRPSSGQVMQELMSGTCCAVLFSACIPSAADVHIALRYPAGLLVISVGAAVALGLA